MPRASIVRGLALLVLGATIGAAGFYFLKAKHWKEERADWFMLEAAARAGQAGRLREGKLDQAIRYEEFLLLDDLQMIGTRFRDHPGALYWMELIEKHFVSNGIPLAAEHVELMNGAKRELKYPGRVLYRQ